MLKSWTPAEVKSHTWYRKTLDKCKSSNGKPFSITLKKGTINKLLVNFAGGGLSWNDETAARPLTSLRSILKIQEGFYISDMPNMLLGLMHVGILSANDIRNPFFDWHIINIPYTTADFHIGNSEQVYHALNGGNKTLYHHGYKNVESAVAILKDFFPGTPESLLIMGESAGAFGCVVHCRAIKKIYADCENIIVYSEGSHIRSALWPQIVNDVWKVSPDLSAYIKSDDLIFDLFRYARDNMPPKTLFLHSNSVWDMELSAFMNKMNYGRKLVNSRILQEFHNTLIETVTKLKKEIPNYSFYLTDHGQKKDNSTPHIFVGTPKLFYDKMQDNLSIADWLVQAVEKNAVDIGEKFIYEQNS